MNDKQMELDERLCSAVEENNLSEVRTLIDAGANVNAQKTQKYFRGPSMRSCALPVLHFAFEWEKEENALPVVELLLDSGADIDARDEINYNWTPLMHAAYMEYPRIVKLLIERGANTTLKDEDGRTVFGLIHAENNDRHHDVLVVLTQATEDGKVWLQSPEGKAWIRAYEIDTTAPIPATPAEVTDVLQHALTANNSEAQQQVLNWVKSGGNLDWRTPNGWTLLHLAAQCGNEKTIRFLVECGADIESRDKRGQTPLILACDTGYVALRMNPSVVEILLDFGADPNAEDLDGRTALRLVRLLESPEASKITVLLEQHGAQQVPVKTATCPECGAPESLRMRERGVQVTLNGVFAELPCPHCGKEAQVPLDAINKAKGVLVSCPSCHSVAFVPPSVWCNTCGTGLSTGWQTLLVSGTSEIEAAQWRHHPIATQYRQMARDIINKYGQLNRFEYLSHFPDFDINFVFERKTVQSGKRRGQHDIHFLSLGYVGEGPSCAREFLAEAGFSMSSDDIKAIKPGAVIQLRNGTVVVEYPPKTTDIGHSASAALCAGQRRDTRGYEKWWQFWR